MRKTILIGLFSISQLIYGQDEKEKVQSTFEDTRIVNGHSVETNQEGSMKFIIAHRFGEVNGGIREFYGLDQSTIRLGFDYGVTDRFTIGVGRSSFQKTVDGFVKGRLLHQTKERGVPFSLTWFSSADIYTTEDLDPDREVATKYRWTYVHQLLVARKFNEHFSLQVMPTFVHRNLVMDNSVDNNIFSIGTAGKIQLSKIVSFKAEYYYSLPDQLSEANTNSLALGFDFETKHHVFQLHFGNSRGMIEKYFITETFGKWEEGDIMFGFNIVRDFQIKGRKYK